MTKSGATDSCSVILEIAMNKTTIMPMKKDTLQTWFSQFKFDAVRSEFADFICQTRQLLDANPDILKKIEEDLDKNALKEKANREKDKEFVRQQTRPLDGFANIADKPTQAPKKQPQAHNKANERLDAGRPRVPALLLYYFLFIRGYLGGSVRSKKAKTFIRESRSLAQLLQDSDLKMSSINSLSENLNVISHETLE